MHRVKVVDAFCPRPYDERSLYSAPMGGTESAIVLLSESLARHSRVEVVQHCRLHSHTSANGVVYRGSDTWRVESSSPDHDTVIVINSPKLMGLWRRNNPGCQILLWRHNFLGNRHKDVFQLLDHYDATMICVSRFHQLDCYRSQRSNVTASRAIVIPNPVQVFANPYVQRNRNTLLFCSSPHKGLDEVVERFCKVRLTLPMLQLRICNPGYLDDSIINEAGIKVLGALTRPQLHAEMSAALCIFYPQTTFRETFGLVGAEANALGIPVLAPTGLGALSETLCGTEQLLDSVAIPQLVRRLKEWRTVPTPSVTAQTRFTPEEVCKTWWTLIQAGRQHSPRRSKAVASSQTTSAIGLT